MRVFVAGATGVIGRRLIPALVTAGHDVVGTSRNPDGASSIETSGVSGVVMDALDRDAVARAVDATRPEVVIHQMTAIGPIDPKHLDESFTMTNRLRTEGLDNLMTAAVESGAQRFIAQSFGGWTNERTGPMVKTEDDPLDSDPSPAARQTLSAIAHLESAVAAADTIEGLVLRYGNLYGPGTALAPGGDTFEAVRARKFPVVGSGAGVWSFLHVDDAAAATVSAVTKGRPGIYNIVDDDPAPVKYWLPFLANAIGAKSPRRVPAVVARLVVGELGVRFMTEIRGASNEKAKRDLGWTPRHPTWRTGFPQLMG